MSEDPEAQRKRALIDTEMDPDSGNPGQDQEETRESSLRTPLPRPGAILGQYRIVEVLGAGGVGEVFRAHDTQLQRDVALKVLRASSLLSATTQKRFVQEARAAGRLRHPGIVAVHEIGREGDLDFIVMDLVECRTLAQVLEGGPLGLDRVLDIGHDLSQALQHAHEEGVLHRDIKPGNVLIDEEDRVYLTDFGLASVVEESSGLTGTGEIVGTPAYFSPEQARGEGADVRSDIYSLGAVLYECLTGMRLYSAGSSLHMIYQIADESIQPPKPRTLRPQVPLEVEAICLHCLEFDSELRYATVGEVAEEIDRYRGGWPIEARSASRWYKFRKWVNRNGSFIILAQITILVMLVVGWIRSVLQVQYYDRLNEARTVASETFIRFEEEVGRQLARLEKSSEQEIGPAMKALDGLLTRLDRRGVRAHLLAKAGVEKLSPLERAQLAQSILVRYDESEWRSRVGWVRARLLVSSGRSHEARLERVRALGGVVGGASAAQILHDLTVQFLVENTPERARRVLEACLPLEEVPVDWQERLGELVRRLEASEAKGGKRKLEVSRVRLGPPLSIYARQLRGATILRLAGFPEEALVELESLRGRDDWGEIGDRAMAQSVLALVELGRIEEAEQLCELGGGRSGPLAHWIFLEQARLRFMLEQFSRSAASYRRASELGIGESARRELQQRALLCDRLDRLEFAPVSEDSLFFSPGGPLRFRCQSALKGTSENFRVLKIFPSNSDQPVWVLRMGEGRCEVWFGSERVERTLPGNFGSPIRVHFAAMAGVGQVCLNLRDAETGRILFQVYRGGVFGWTSGSYRVEMNPPESWSRFEVGVSR
ncbi:MAG: serine/threonine-protein kinase [Planctomycetota bacterium]|nr:serine/threonine-protein kinase [Planctomycetota bacterium]